MSGFCLATRTRLSRRRASSGTDCMVVKVKIEDNAHRSQIHLREDGRKG